MAGRIVRGPEPPPPERRAPAWVSTIYGTATCARCGEHATGGAAEVADFVMLHSLCRDVEESHRGSRVTTRDRVS